MGKKKHKKSEKQVEFSPIQAKPPYLIQRVILQQKFKPVETKRSWCGQVWLAPSNGGPFSCPCRDILGW